MKDFLKVLKFELLSYFKNKAFIIATVIICLLLVVGLSLPTLMDTFSKSDQEDTADIPEEEEIQEQTYGYINRDEALSNVEDLKDSFIAGTLVEFQDQEKLEKDILDGKVEAGFIIQSPTKYEYVVKNNEMMDNKRYFFEEALARAYRIKTFEERGIAYREVEDVILANIESDTKALDKDSVNNYLYTYILIFGLYFITMLYGQLIATSVASEKSNRTMEVLVTSTDSRNLIFGKVLGGALAGALQFGFLIAIATMAYRLNASAWDNKLDFIFNIPGEIILTFAVFGILGYCFYSFIYGALGALVSRTEDVSASATPVTLLFVAVFFISFIGMQNTEGILLKVASFVPFSSFMAMFVRISMGSVTTLEVIISLTILTATTIGVGFLAVAIYRMGTLMYGNPIKLKKAIKLLRK